MALCRLENRAGRKEAWLIHQILFDQFVGSFESAPSELTLDLDCTDDRVHGLQEGRHFHGYYYDFCFLPLYCLLWRTAVGQLPAREQHRFGQTCLGDFGVVGQGVAAKLAGGKNYGARRQRLLSLEDAALV